MARPRARPTILGCSMDPLPVSAAAARRFLVRRHLLAPPRSLPAGLDGVRAVFARLGSIQFDPLAVAGRNHDLVLHARVRDYDPAWTNELLYERRELFETYNKMLSLLPTASCPGIRLAWDRFAAEHRTAPSRGTRETVEHVLERIRDEGPLSQPRLREARHDRLVLGTHQRGPCRPRGPLGGRRHQPRPARGQPTLLRPHRAALPGRACWPHRPDERDQQRHKLLSRYRAHGLLGEGGQAELWYGIAWASARRRTTDRGRPRPRQACARSSWPPATSCRSPSRACAARATSSATEVAMLRDGRGRDRAAGTRLTRRRRHLPGARSTPSSGTATCCAASSASTTSGRSTRRRRSGAGATTCCRSSSATGSWAASSRASTARRAPSASSGLWWEAGFRRGARTASWSDARRLAAYLRFAGSGARLGRLAPSAGSSVPALGSDARPAGHARSARRVGIERHHVLVTRQSQRRPASGQRSRR